MEADQALGQMGRPQGASLLFAEGLRPSAEALMNLFASGGMAGAAARISHRSEDCEGWLEILASGLTFDLRGLVPADPAPECKTVHAYGFTDGMPDEPLAAVEIVPGAHVAAGAVLLPVVRAMAGLTANLALNLPVSAVAWHAAGTCMEPRFFSRSVFNWLAGGTFPAQCLTALVRASDGRIGSQGLAVFAGQEMQLVGAPEENPADAMRLAVNVVDYLVRNGPIAAPCEITGLGPALVAEPSGYGNLVWIWRKK